MSINQILSILDNEFVWLNQFKYKWGSVLNPRMAFEIDERLKLITKSSNLLIEYNRKKGEQHE